MKSIQIDAGTSRLEIHRQLREFGLFSAVEAKVDDQDANVIHLREVGVGERLRNFLSGRGRADGERKSRDAMRRLGEARPEIRKLLGESIFMKRSWTAVELMQGLKVNGAGKLERGRDGALQVAGTQRLGVANALAEEIRADSRIAWSLNSSSSKDIAAYDKVTVHPGANGNRIQVLTRHDPTPAEQEDAYRHALGAGGGHVVIAPIKNNAESVDCLLKVIDEFMSQPGWCDRNRVTIAAGGEPGLPDLVWDRKAVHDAELQRKALQGDGMVAMPASLLALEEGGQMKVKSGGEDIEGYTRPTGIPGVSLYQGDPGKLEASLAILQEAEVAMRAEELRRQGRPRLHEVCEAAFRTPGLVSDEARAIKEDAARKWGLCAVQLPACELPAQRLVAISHLPNQQVAPEDAEQFFMRHLQGVRGRAVVELTGVAAIDQAAWAAVQALYQADPHAQREIVFASPMRGISAALRTHA